MPPRRDAHVPLTSLTTESLIRARRHCRYTHSHDGNSKSEVAGSSVGSCCGRADGREVSKPWSMLSSVVRRVKKQPFRVRFWVMQNDAVVMGVAFLLLIACTSEILFSACFVLARAANFVLSHDTP